MTNSAETQSVEALYRALKRLKDANVLWMKDSQVGLVS